MDSKRESVDHDGFVPRGSERDQGATERDRRAEVRDRAAEGRDRAADARDRLAIEQARIRGEPDHGADDRGDALLDREQAEADRADAAGDRDAAEADRAFAALERAAYWVDELTGAHRREAGIAELGREIARARRAEQPLALAFVDVDDLKVRNDSAGHAAGDQLLRQVVDSIRTQFRPYDLIIRLGGDEFLCVLPELTAAQAEDRFSLVNAELASTEQASISVGLVEFEADDTAEDLIKRADKAMYDRRQRPRSGP